MNESRPYFLLTALLFAIVGLAHLVRAFAAWPVVINGMDVPVVLSWPVGLAALALGAWGFVKSRG